MAKKTRPATEREAAVAQRIFQQISVTAVPSDARAIIVSLSLEFWNEASRGIGDVEIDHKSVLRQLRKLLQEADMDVPVMIFYGCRIDLVR